MIRKLAALLVFCSALALPLSGQAYRKGSATSDTETLHQGKVSRARSELFFEFPEGRIINWNLSPEEYIYISNPMGEARIYYPRKNNLIVRKDQMFSSKNHHFFQFLNNQYFDLGLEDEGFRVSGTKNDGAAVVTTYQAPVHLLAQVDKIELVHEDLVPIYAAYRNTRGEIILKIYYEDFTPVYESMVPGRVTEIIFTPQRDSMIKRTTYTDIKTGTQANQRGFNFIIPEDAKVVQ